MKLRRLVVIVSLTLIVALLASMGTACTSEEQKTQNEAEAVIEDYIEASYLQDAVSARGCLHSIALAEFREDDWPLAQVLPALFEDIDDFDLEFSPFKEGQFDSTPLISVECRISSRVEEGHWALDFFLVEEQGEWRILGWQQAILSD